MTDYNDPKPVCGQSRCICAGNRPFPSGVHQRGASQSILPLAMGAGILKATAQDAPLGHTFEQ